MKVLQLVCLCSIVLLAVSCAGSPAENKDVNQETVLQLDMNAVSFETESRTIEGSVRLVKENAGTLSEIRYYVLVTGAKSSLILFNEKGFSTGFDQWLDLPVQVSGRKGTGKIGFRKQEEIGLIVAHIERVD